MQKRTLFLDVDGVLHPFSATSFFHAPCMSALRQVVQQTGASIVLSSSWQATPTSLGTVNAALQANGIPPCVSTTVEPSATGRSRPATSENGRAKEILAWVAAHPDACSGGWVAVDDMGLACRLPTDNFVLLGGPDASVPPLPPPPSKPGGFNSIVTRGEMQRDMMRAAMAATS